jgi:hypothetical protein
MDFSQRGSHQNQTVNTATPNGDRPVGGKGKRRDSGGVMRWITGGLLIAITILIVAVIIGFVTGAPKHESDFINSKTMQAVFLNNGQVYFGNIKTLNNKYMELQNIYYLRVNQTVQPNQSNNSSNSNDVSLVKLGCELHGPSDQMVINSDQITFWENLKTDGQVAKAVANYVKANPNGQTCTASTNSSTPNSSTKSNSTTNKQQ